MQIFPWFDITLKERIEVIEKVHPVMEIPLHQFGSKRLELITSPQKMLYIKSLIYTPCRIPMQNSSAAILHSQEERW
jgi:hypothetical protein